MPEYTHTAQIEHSVDQVWSWYDSPGAFRRIMPEWEGISPVQAGALEDGEYTKFQVSIGPMKRMWVARHYGVVDGEKFCDTMEKGPFGAWDHKHQFKSTSASTMTLVDTVNWRLPIHPLTFWAAPFAVNGRMKRMFNFRTTRVQNDLHRIAKFAHLPRQRILVSGSTGLIGLQLCAFLSAAGHHVTRLIRPSTVLPADAKDDEVVVWDDQLGQILEGEINGFDTVIHLAGAGIGDRRWSKARKSLIETSRTVPTNHLANLLASLDRPPATFICGSAIGFYGNRGDELLNESSAPGENFLADVCQRWEGAAQPAVDAGIRTIWLRTGLVITPMGGVLRKLLLPAKLGAGGPAGNGRQFYAWISLDDQIYAIHHLMMSESCKGVFNLTAPTPVPQKKFAKILGRVLRRPAFAPLPGFFLKIMLGKMAQGLVLDGQRVLPERLEASGYAFQHEDLESCLRHCLGRG